MSEQTKTNEHSESFESLGFVSKKQIEAINKVDEIANKYFISQLEKHITNKEEIINIPMPYNFAETGIYESKHISNWKKILKEQFPEYYITNYRFCCNCEPNPCWAYDILSVNKDTCAYVKLGKRKESICNLYEFVLN